MSEVNNPVLGYADSYRREAKRGQKVADIWSVIAELERNIAPLFTAAQSELAALREELARLNRVKLALAEQVQVHSDNCSVYRVRLAAAEQRNAECITLLRRSTSNEDQDHKTWWNERALILQASIKPTESGASE